MLTFKDSSRSKLKDESTSNLKIQEILSKLGINAEVYMRDNNVSTGKVKVNIHRTKGKHRVASYDHFDILMI